jgi:hypothetical protein
MSRTRRPDGGRAARWFPQQAARQGPDAGLARPGRAEGWCVPPRSGRLRGPAGAEQGEHAADERGGGVSGHERRALLGRRLPRAAGG